MELSDLFTLTLFFGWAFIIQYFDVKDYYIIKTNIEFTETAIITFFIFYFLSSYYTSFELKILIFWYIISRFISYAVYKKLNKI